jgi:hypothetical protein
VVLTSTSSAFSSISPLFIFPFLYFVIVFFSLLLFLHLNYFFYLLLHFNIGYVSIFSHFILTMLLQEKKYILSHIDTPVMPPEVSLSSIQSLPRNRTYYKLNPFESLIPILILSLNIYIYIYPCFSSYLFSLCFTYNYRLSRICHSQTHGSVRPP